MAINMKAVRSQIAEFGASVAQFNKSSQDVVSLTIKAYYESDCGNYDCEAINLLYPILKSAFPRLADQYKKCVLAGTCTVYKDEKFQNSDTKKKLHKKYLKAMENGTEPEKKAKELAMAIAEAVVSINEDWKAYGKPKKEGDEKPKSPWTAKQADSLRQKIADNAANLKMDEIDDMLREVASIKALLERQKARFNPATAGTVDENGNEIVAESVTADTPSQDDQLAERINAIVDNDELSDDIKEAALEVQQGYESGDLTFEQASEMMDEVEA